MTYTPHFTITPKINSLLDESDRLYSSLRAVPLLPAVQASIRYRSTVESIHSSTSIEGNPLNIRQVRAVIASKLPLSRREYAAIEVRNYKKALDYIIDRRHGDQWLTLEDVLTLHRLITGRLLDRFRSGHWRRNPVYIEGRDGEVIYTAAPAPQVETLVRELLDWANSQSHRLDPILIAGIIHERFVAIHPFADGNGRTARALTFLYLTLHHRDVAGSLSLDYYYASDRASYYHLLAQTNGKDFAHATKADLTAWLEYFTAGYLSSLRILEAEIKLLQLTTTPSQQATLDPLDVDIMSFVSQLGSITISEAQTIIPEVSRRSLQRRLKSLVERGFLETTGNTHQLKYRLVPGCIPPLLTRD